MAEQRRPGLRVLRLVDLKLAHSPLTRAPPEPDLPISFLHLGSWMDTQPRASTCPNITLAPRHRHPHSAHT